jgi:hypothetical protein
MSMNRVVSLSVMALFFSAEPGFPQSVRAQAQNVPEIPFESVPNLLKLPAHLQLGEAVGVATNSKGHVFVFTRSAETHLLEFASNGAFLREIGEGLYGFLFAHAVRIDSQDNIWVIDEGSNMVIKFDPQGRVMMLLGRRPESTEGLAKEPATQPEPYRFNRPTDVAWDSAGNIFISDGYGNSRVVKYNKNGEFIKSIGSRGTEPGQFNTPHAIAVDTQGDVFVADRNNFRIQVFDNDLNFKKVYDQVGAPWAICLSLGAHQYLYSSNSNSTNNDFQARSYTGEIYKMELDATILGKFGRSGKQMGEVSSAHEIDCRNPNEVFVGEITTWRVQKIILHPQPGVTKVAK